MKNLQYLPISIDESTDATDTAQLGIFTCTVLPNFDIYEDFVGLFPMKSIIIGENSNKA